MKFRIGNKVKEKNGTFEGIVISITEIMKGKEKVIEVGVSPFSKKRIHHEMTQWFQEEELEPYFPQKVSSLEDHEKPPRKVISLTTIPPKEKIFLPRLYALCNDGEIFDFDFYKNKWIKLPQIPQD